MDFEAIKENLMSAFRQLLVLRLIVSSPNEKVADLPALYVLIAVLIAPWVCLALLVLGFLGRYSARFEKDAARV
ncbi:MAG: hypothetical protein PUH70_08895 [Clostridiales bacterium]|nr:hypothetical protein [Clostridiales bacterium]MDY5348351.1 hypothetical protein [Candidatus Ventricola sp.]MDY5514739.1 hypothetical protein [Candidatus Ventricola sp.]